VICTLLGWLRVGRTNLAILLQQMDAKANKARIEKLLRLALADAKRLQLPEAKQIEGIMKQFDIKEKNNGA